MAGDKLCLKHIMPMFIRLYAYKNMGLPPDSNTTNKAEFSQIFSEAELGSVVGQMLAREPLEDAWNFQTAIDTRQYSYEGGKLIFALELQFADKMQSESLKYESTLVLQPAFQPDWIQVSERHKEAETNYELDTVHIQHLMKILNLWRIEIDFVSNSMAKLGDLKQELQVLFRNTDLAKVLVNAEGKGAECVQEIQFTGSRASKKAMPWATQFDFREFSFRTQSTEGATKYEYDIEKAEINTNERLIHFLLK